MAAETVSVQGVLQQRKEQQQPSLKQHEYFRMSFRIPLKRRHRCNWWCHNNMLCPDLLMFRILTVHPSVGNIVGFRFRLSRPCICLRTVLGKVHLESL